MRLRRLIDNATGLPGATLRAMSGAVTGVVERRQVHTAPGGTRIRVRGVHRPGGQEVAESLVKALLKVAGVVRAEVNGPLGLVMIAHDEETPVDALLDVVEAVEALHGVSHEPFAAPGHPASRQTVLREAALAGVYLAGGGAAVVGRIVRATPLPPGVSTLVAMADASPQVRTGLERRIGRPATDLLLGTGVVVSHVLAYQPTGPVINSVHRIIRIVEAREHAETWIRRAHHLAPVPGAFQADPLDVPERPVPLPYGSVERAAWTIPAALAAATGTYALGRDVDRAQGVLAAGVPKAARMGRDAFAAQLGISACRRDVLVVEPDVLRRLDRVDQVVLDASALRTGELVVEEVVTVSEVVAPEDAYARAHALVDVHRLSARHEDGRWAIGPLRSSRAAELGDRPEARGQLAAMRESGATVLLLTYKDEPVALVPVLVELDPVAESLIATARKACRVAVAGTAAAVRRRLPPVDAVPGGSRLLTSVRRLQEEGRAVLLISSRGGAALAAADVGVGVLGRNGHPPWGAHVLCGPGLAAAHSLVGALLPAREASARAARIAEVGSVAGALLAATGTPRNAARRAQLAVDLAALSALATGTWAGLAVNHRPAVVPVDRTPWHAWPAQAVLDRLDSTRSGLPEAEAVRRRALVPGGEPSPPGLARVTAEELDNPLTPALAAGAGVSAVVGSVTDAALIGSVLGVNALMSGVQRVGADRALKRLVDLSAVRVRIRRPGREEEVTATAEELVPGDVVMLGAGDAVPADLRILTADDLEVDESSLTGESQLVTKSARPSVSKSVADRTSMLYEGSVVAAGTVTGVVVATGDRTEIGRTAHLTDGRRPGGVESRLRSLTAMTLPVAFGAGAGLFLSDLLRGRTMAQALGPAVSLAVAAVPEGLPFVATAAELATARRMSRRGALVRDPSTIEALGRIDILCFDKTGTLTEGRLSLRMVSDGEASFPAGDRSPKTMTIVAAALRASPEQTRTRLPHPTDRAIIRGARTLKVTGAEGLGAWDRVDELPFEPARGYHAVLGRTPKGQVLSVKGAPEVVLERCEGWTREEGTVPFDGELREKAEQEVDRLARMGYRVLAVAERKASGRQDLDESRIDRLNLLGLVCIADPVRPTAAEAVTRLRRAGVDIMMITGDHPTTAEAIAAELKLLNGGRIMTGADLDALADDALAGALDGVTVCARVSPEQKARVVRGLRAAGRVVAVTGDGANDAPAIRLADVGIALGERATPAARETADVVVTDDRIETITDAIADCRAMWRSTRDALAVLLGGNLGEIAFTVLTGLVSGSSPLNVRQLLLVNLLTDMLPAVALAARPPSGVTREELLQEGPDRSLGSALTRDIAVRAGATAGAAITAWTLGRMSGTREQAGSVALVALVGTQLGQTLVAGGRDPMVLVSSLASMGALAVIVQVPGLSHFFGSRPLMPHGWLIALGCAGAFAAGAVLVTRLPSGTLVAYVPGARVVERLAQDLRDGIVKGSEDGLPAIAAALPDGLADEAARNLRTAWRIVWPTA